jgi:D-lactate dehydrogenase (cytochrome)
MKKVISFNEEDLDIQVEAGLGYIELNEMLKPKGLWFPLDPGPGATVGGSFYSIYVFVYDIALIATK